MNPNPPPLPEIEIDVEFQGEVLPNLKVYIEEIHAGAFAFTDDYKLNGVRGNMARAGGNNIHDVVRAEIAKEYVVPRGTFIMLIGYDVNKAVYGLRGQPPLVLKRKDDMDVEGGRKRRRKTRKTRKTRRSRSYRYLKG